MENLKEILENADFDENSLPGIEINTYLKLWSRVIFLSKEKDGKRTSDFIPIRSGKFIEQQFYIAAGLLELGVEKGDFVAVYSPNSLRYAVSVFSILSIGAVLVPIYPTISEDTFRDLVYHSETRYIFIGDISQYQKTCSIMNKAKSPLRKLIVNYSIESTENNVLTYDKLISIGKESNRIEEVIESIKNLSSDDTAALIYTLGTDGTPKGVILSHENFIAQKEVSKFIKINSNDTRLAHLPFSHVFGLSAELFASAVTGSVTAICGRFETEEILNNLSEIRPTILSSVPRIYEKLYVYVLQRINQFKKMKRIIYYSALEIGKTCFIKRCKGERIPLTIKILNSIYFIIYRRIRKSVGINNIKYFFSGGSPLPVEVAYFFGGIGRPIIEGYGLTETAPIINMNRPDRIKPGTVGPPISGVEEKISDEGEILVKGPMLYKGYFGMPEEIVRETHTGDGFFKTGDVGTFDEDGYLIITGRLKDLLITSGGKNVAPLTIEKRFEKDNLIDCICVVGDRRKYLTALVVPDFKNLVKYAKDHNIEFKDEDDLVKNQDIIALYKKRINDISDAFARYEQIKKFTILPEQFSTETGELSLAYKFRRSFIQQKYKDIIDKMYPSSELIE